MQEQIGVTKDDLEAHVQKSTHVQKMQELMESEPTAAENQKKEILDMVAVSVRPTNHILNDVKNNKNVCHFRNLAENLLLLVMPTK